MKYVSGSIIVFFLSLFAFTKLVGPIPLSISSVTTQKTDTFTVTGEGKITMIPDIAVVQVGITAEGSNVSLAQQQLNQKMNAISDSIKRQGIDSKDIQTNNYSISPKYKYDDGSQRIIGYLANSNLTIKVRKIDSANAIIDAATANGANQVGGITFDVNDKAKATNLAREEAVKDAKSKAQAAAKAAGFRLGKIINYSEGGGSGPRPIMMESSLMDSAGKAAPTQVEPGSSELTLNVTLSFEIN